MSDVAFGAGLELEEPDLNYALVHWTLQREEDADLLADALSVAANVVKRSGGYANVIGPVSPHDSGGFVVGITCQIETQEPQEPQKRPHWPPGE